MLFRSNTQNDLARVLSALPTPKNSAISRAKLPVPPILQEMSIREAIFVPQEIVPAEESLHRICAAPTVACPPAIPVAVSGEKISPEALALFRYYGIEHVAVVK